MLFPHHMLAYLATISAGTAVAASNHLFSSQDFRIHAKRQGNAYPPTTVQCGTGATCDASCGPGYILCGSQAEFLCYNPSAGDTCCAPGADDAWSCDASSFCLVNGHCCPNSDDPATCAQANGVSLPANFSTSTLASSTDGYVMSSFGVSVATAYTVVTTGTTEHGSSSAHATASVHTKSNYTYASTIPSTLPTTSHQPTAKHSSTTMSITKKVTATATVTIPFSSGTLNGTFFTPTVSAASTSIAALTGGAKTNVEITVKGLILMVAGIWVWASRV